MFCYKNFFSVITNCVNLTFCKNGSFNATFVNRTKLMKGNLESLIAYNFLVLLFPVLHQMKYAKY